MNPTAWGRGRGRCDKVSGNIVSSVLIDSEGRDSRSQWLAIDLVD